MDRVANLVHHGIAHFFPALADEIVEKTLERYSVSMEYSSTPEGNKTWETTLDMFNDLEYMLIDFQEFFIDVLAKVNTEGDLHVSSDLMEMLRKVNFVVEQGIVLNDKAHLFGLSGMGTYDSHVEKHWHLKEMY